VDPREGETVSLRRAEAHGFTETEVRIVRARRGKVTLEAEGREHTLTEGGLLTIRAPFDFELNTGKGEPPKLP